MPELPEVEASRKFVEDHCVGHTIIRSKVADDDKVLCDVNPQALEEALNGRTILGAHRKGKHLWLELDQRPWPAFQFGMAGAILIKNFRGVQYTRKSANDGENWPSKYSKVLVELENGVEMAFTDKRRFARIRLLQDPPTQSPISELGPDAYLEYPAEESFVQAIQLRKGSIKGILLDQSFMAGIGNWIADEVLYQARIHPVVDPPSMTSEDYRKLYIAIKEVLQWSVRLNADHENFPKDWIFHHRWNKRPGSCVEGNEIQFISVGGRTSAFVPALQKSNRLPKVSTTKRKASKREILSVDADQEKEKSLPENAPGRVYSRKRGKKILDAEVVVLEQGLEKTVAPIVLAAEVTATRNSSRMRKTYGKTSDGDEDYIPGTRKAKRSKTITSAKRKQPKALENDPSAIFNLEGEQNLTILAYPGSSTGLQNLENTQNTLEADATT